MPRSKKKNKKDVKPKLIIFCEGKNTEPHYLQALISDKFAANHHLFDFPFCDKNTPKELVDDAKLYRQNNIGTENDEYWVVFDAEGRERSNGELKIAFEKARSAKINIAISNISFETWLLCHFTSNPCIVSQTKDMFNPRKCNLVKYMREAGLRDYQERTSKRSEITKRTYKSLQDKYGDAKRNAVTMNKESQSSAQNNNRWEFKPYTEVVYLVKAMEAFYERYSQ